MCIIIWSLPDTLDEDDSLKKNKNMYALGCNSYLINLFISRPLVIVMFHSL